MKTILKIGREACVMPQAKAFSVMQAMAQAIRLEQDFNPVRDANGDRDFRDRYVADHKPLLIGIEQIEDDQIRIPPGVSTDKPSAKSRKALPPVPVRQLGFGGVA